MSASDAEKVVALSRWRAWVARSSNARRRFDAILADPGAPERVPAIPVQEFYYLVKDIGLGDAGPLLQLASPEQVQTCLDFDIWERDQVDPERVLPWLEALGALPPAKLARVVAGLDFELLSLLFARHARVHDRSANEEAAPEFPFPVYETPDAFFFVEFVTPRAELAAALERLLDALYRADAEFAQRLLLDAQWGLPSELEETSYRWRSGRMADLGFCDYFDALEVYAYLDPRQARARLQEQPVPPRGSAHGNVAFPVPFAESMGEEGFLERVLSAFEVEEELQEIVGELVALFNRVLAADRADPGDLEQVRSCVRSARDTLSLGLEYLAERDVARGRRLLRERGLVEIFRVGFSLTAELGRRARELQERGVEDPTLDALLAHRPRYPRALDTPPFAGDRPFRSLEDLRRVEAFLEALREAQGEGGTDGPAGAVLCQPREAE